MSSAAQINANRMNAQQSTGPKTPQGINNSKFNAIRHGLTGKQVVIPGEDPAEYDAFRASLVEAYEPQSEIEAVLVEQAANNWWRLRRARRMEKEILERYGTMKCLTDPEASKIFKNVTRYLNSIERSWKMAVTELDKIRAERRKAATKAAESKAPSSAIGFVSQQPLQLVKAPATPPADSGPTPSLADASTGKSA